MFNPFNRASNRRSKENGNAALVEVGEVCTRFQDEAFHNLNSKRVRADELWAFVDAKEKNVTLEIAAKHGGARLQQATMKL
jgi:hypothetical protein